MKSASPYKTYTPLVFSNPGIRGVEVRDGQAAKFELALAQAHPYWVRAFIRWDEVEPNRGDRNWISTGFDKDYPTLVANGAEIMLVIKDAPRWARLDDRICSRPINMSAWSVFLHELVTRYPKVLYFEIGNEPDSPVDADVLPYGYYGCWGDPTKPYFGGEDYARIFNTAKTAIMIRSKAKVLVGGLMLPLGTPQATYFEGLVRAGTKFDGVAFHYYAWCATGNTSPEPQVQFLRDIMARYQYVRPIWMTETSMLYTGDPGRCESQQADYVDYIYQETNRLGLRAFMWYALQDTYWNNSSLYNGPNPKPAFTRFSSYDD